MAFIKLQFKPGVNRDQTDYSNEGGWYECDKIRFRSGYPEKLGGWVKATPTTFIGVCRQMWNWVTTYQDNFLALGTNEKVYIEAGGNFFDITPLRDTTPTLSTPDTNNCVNTSNTTNVITINLAAAHDALTGDYVQIGGVAGATIGGIPVSQINGNHQITVIDADSFSFTVSAVADSTVSNTGGTAITIGFEIKSGNAITVAGYGWGIGAWGRDAWGLGTTGSPIYLPQRDWWFDNFDNDLVMNIRNGEGYWWVRGTTDDPASALDTKAIRLSQYAFDWATATGAPTYTPTQYADAVPIQIMQLLVSQQDKHLIAFGAVPFGSTSTADFDPLLIRWADQDTPEDWIPTPTNTAGDLRISRGSRIVRGLPTRQEILVWTDTNLYTLQFLGTTDVFGLQEYADNISIASPRAVASAANITYWMGQDKFYAYTGRVETLPCTLRNHVFNNLNYGQADQIVCGTNEQWNEVWWFYPAYGADYNNAYVIYNHLERIWYYGSIDRTAWLDTPLRQNPQGANTTITVDGLVVTISNSFLYNHENGLNDDVLPMDSYIQSSDFDLDDGDQFMMTRRILPDVGFDGSTAASPEVTLTVRPRNFPGSAFSADAADTQRVIETSVGVYTDQVFMRARARQMAFKIRSETLGVQWQLGAPRLDARPDGRR
jgi:hypothetical protein